MSVGVSIKTFTDRNGVKHSVEGGGGGTDPAIIEELAAKADKVDGALENHLAAFDDEGNLKDGGATSQFAAASHSHEISGVNGLQTALNGKAASDHTHSDYAAASHTHTIDKVIGLQDKVSHIVNVLPALADVNLGDEYLYVGATDGFDFGQTYVCANVLTASGELYEEGVRQDFIQEMDNAIAYFNNHSFISGYGSFVLNGHSHDAQDEFRLNVVLFPLSDSTPESDFLTAIKTAVNTASHLNMAVDNTSIVQTTTDKGWKAKYAKAS